MKRIVKAGIYSGLAGGALDIAAACIVYPLVYPTVTMTRVLQSVAVGVLGPESYSGGISTALLGLALHFFIALCAGLVFAFAMSRAEILRRLWPLSGAVWGVSMYFFMQKIVLPLSNVGATNPDMKSMTIGIVIHIFIFGIPMALIARNVLKDMPAPEFRPI